MPERIENIETLKARHDPDYPVTNADKQGWVEMDLNEIIPVQVGDRLRLLTPDGIIEGYFDGQVRWLPSGCWAIQLRTGETDAIDVTLEDVVSLKIKN